MLAALKNRPEVGQVTDERRVADVNESYAKNQTKPQVDLNLGYTANGFAGQPLSLLQNPVFGVFGPVFTSVNQLIAYADSHGAKIPPLIVAVPPAPAHFTGGFGTAMDNLLANRLPEAAVSVTIGFPIANRTARANLRLRRQQQQSITVQQAGADSTDRLRGAQSVQSLQAARSRLIASSAARTAAERVYASELRKFRAGTSTTFLVLQRQTELGNQRARELLAQTDLDKAVVELERVAVRSWRSDGVNVRRRRHCTDAGDHACAAASPPPLPQISPLP